uniref:Uncharacterized protein n=1 Tax=Paramormyrops kingsleyae TaxID=1676925 RepID=A0A3B3S8J3_9TELE
MPTGSQIKLLLWKNWTLHKGQKIRLFVEIMRPAVLCLGLVCLRKGMFCNVNNPCFQYSTPGESPGPVSNYQNSILARFYGDVQELLLSDPNFQQMGRLWNELTIMSTFMDTLRNNPTQISASLRCIGAKLCDCCAELVGLIDVISCVPLATQFASGVPDLRLKDLACSQALLECYIIFPSPEVLYAVREAMCTLSQQKLHAIEESMDDNIDFFKLFRLVSPLKLIS